MLDSKDCNCTQLDYMDAGESQLIGVDRPLAGIHYHSEEVYRLDEGADQGLEDDSHAVYLLHCIQGELLVSVSEEFPFDEG